MSSPVTPSIELTRLLAYLEHDAANMTLRKVSIRTAFDTNQWEVAGELLEAGLALHPEEPELLALSGFAHLHAQRYIDAEQALSAALEYGLEAEPVIYNLAYALYMQRRYSSALELLHAPSISQAVPIAALLRARCLHHLGRVEEAIANCRDHLSVASNHAETNGVLALLLCDQERTEAAREYAEAALQQDSTQLEALLALASIEAEIQAYDAAQARLEELLLAHPQCGRAWLQMALIELNYTNLEMARRYIERAAALMPEHIGAWHVLAWIHIMLGDDPNAQAAFERALDLNRNFAESHGGLAVIAARQGREEEARASIKRALRLDPQSMAALYAQMLLMQQYGQHREAEALLESVLARPVPRGDVTFRDLVTAQMRHLHTRKRFQTTST